jgi:hypothetical protein
MGILASIFGKKKLNLTNSQISALSWIIILGNINRLKEGTVHFPGTELKLNIPKGTNVPIKDYIGAINVALKIYQLKTGGLPPSTSLSGVEIKRESDLLYRLCLLYSGLQNIGGLPDLSNNRLLRDIDEFEKKLHLFFAKRQRWDGNLDVFKQDHLDVLKEHLGWPGSSYIDAVNNLVMLRKRVDPKYKQMIENG